MRVIVALALLIAAALGWCSFNWFHLSRNGTPAELGVYEASYRQGDTVRIGQLWFDVAKARDQANNTGLKFGAGALLFLCVGLALLGSSASHAKSVVSGGSNSANSQQLEYAKGISMGLIDCPACGQRVSSQAYGCPGCGHPITASRSTESQPLDPPPPGRQGAEPRNPSTSVWTSPLPSWVTRIGGFIISAVLVLVTIAGVMRAIDSQRKSAAEQQEEKLQKAREDLRNLKQNDIKINLKK